MYTSYTVASYLYIYINVMCMLFILTVYIYMVLERNVNGTF